MLRLLFLVTAAGLALAVKSSSSPPPPPPQLLIGRDPQGNEIYYSDSTDTEIPNYVNGVYSGQKYECVEYARRWLIRSRGVTFQSVRDAVELLSLRQAEAISPQKKVPVVRADKLPPQVGDLLIFAANEANDYFGHVAVVVRVHGDRVDIGEQNHSKARWTRDYSRSIPIVNGLLSDPNVAGVVRILK